MNDFDKYRFYHCYQKPTSVVCHYIDNASIKPSEPSSHLSFVPKHFPENLDALVLNFKYNQPVRILKNGQ